MCKTLRLPVSCGSGVLFQRRALHDARANCALERIHGGVLHPGEREFEMKQAVDGNHDGTQVKDERLGGQTDPADPPEMLGVSEPAFAADCRGMRQVPVQIGSNDDSEEREGRRGRGPSAAASGDTGRTAGSGKMPGAESGRVSYFCSSLLELRIRAKRRTP